jgi:hypothetical protein
MSPTTVARLSGLKPGEVCRWYAGDIVRDAQNADTPNSNALLKALHEDVLALARGGGFALSTNKAMRAVKPRREGGKPQRVEVTEYFATRVKS